MPTYQYACTACDERLEAVQRFTDTALTECPVCGGALRKVFSAVGVVFKGSGFYKNDSRDSGKKAGATKEPATAGASSDSSGTAASSSSGSAGGSDSGSGSGSDSGSGSGSGSGSKETKAAPATKTPPATPVKKSA